MCGLKTRVFLSKRNSLLFFNYLKISICTKGLKNLSLSTKSLHPASKLSFIFVMCLNLQKLQPVYLLFCIKHL